MIISTILRLPRWRIHLPMQDTQVRSLGWEDPLEKEMATHSSILAWEIPWHGQRSLEGYSPWGRQESGMTEQLSRHTHTHTQSYVTKNLCNLQRKDGIVKTNLNLLVRDKIKTKNCFLSREWEHLTRVPLRLTESKSPIMPLFLPQNFSLKMKTKIEKPEVRSMPRWMPWNANYSQACDIPFSPRSHCIGSLPF